jgi:MFS family permease
LAVIASLLLMNITVTQTRAAQRRVWQELHEGWRYVVESVAIRSILLLLAIVSLVGFPYSVLMPIFASDILRGGPHTLGFLMAASGVGALVGAILLAMRKSVLGLGRYIAICAALFGAALMGFSLSRSLWLSLPLLAATGFGFMQQMASSNTVLQTIVEDEKRGRVMAFYGMAFLGMAPFGSLLAGGLAARIGAPATLLWCGAAVLVASVWFARRLPAIRAEVRPIYVKLGILPEMALAVQQVSALQTPPED